MTPPPDPFDLSADLRSYAELLRSLLEDRDAVACPEAREAVVLIAAGLDARADRCDAALGAALGAEAEARQAEAVRLVLLRHQDAAHGVLRLMARPAPAPVAPRPMARVLPFRRASAPAPVHVIGCDVPGGAA